MRVRVAVLAAISLVLIAAPATADQVLGTKQNTTYVSAKQTIVTDREATVDARCPSGTHVWGGGFDSDTHHITAESSRPFDGPDPDNKPDDGWLAHLDASAPDQGQVFAICRKSEPIYRSHPTSHADATAGSVSARCPGGTQVISGGGSAGGGEIFATFSYSSGDAHRLHQNGWRLRAKLGPASKLEAVAICVDRAVPVKRGGGSLFVRGDSFGGVGVGCSSHRPVLGLAARIRGPISGITLHAVSPIPFSPDHPNDGDLPDGGAQVLVTNHEAQPRLITAHTVCNQAERPGD